MRKVVLTIILSVAYLSSYAFDIKCMSVDFEKKELKHNGCIYELVEVKNRQRSSWREVTYLCIDSKLHAVAFRLFVTDGGDFVRLQKYTSKK